VLFVHRERTMRAIAHGVAEHFGITLAEMRSVTRLARISRPRQEAMRQMYATGLYSNAQIARFFGLKDHKTVVHGRRAAEARAA
jgi:chromosomal replication initiator protein